MTNQIHDDFIMNQRATMPIAANRRKQTMLDLVEFGRAGRIMADGDGLGHLGIRKVVAIHVHGRFRRMIFLAMVFIMADSFVLFPVDRNHGVASRVKRLGWLGDQGELLIPIRMITPRFEPLAVRWHGIVMSSESSQDRLRTHRHPLSGKGFGQMVEALFVHNHGDAGSP